MTAVQKKNLGIELPHVGMWWDGVGAVVCAWIKTKNKQTNERTKKRTRNIMFGAFVINKLLFVSSL